MAGRKEGPLIMGEHLYDGIWYPNVVLDSSIERLKNFEVRSDDIWIITFPKSGTHWILEIVGLILADGYPEKVDRSLNSSSVVMINIDQKFPASRADEETNPVDMSPFLDVVDKAQSPRVTISHLRLERYPEDILKKSKVIYVARNPKDVIVSWFNFVGQNPSLPVTLEKVIQKFMAGTSHYGPWFEHVEEFWKIRDHENLAFLFYEEMLKDPVGHIRKIAEHIGHPLSEETLQRVLTNSTFDSMKSTFNKMAESGKAALVKAQGKFSFLHKGVYGGWKNHFTVAQNEAFDEWFKQKVAESDLSFTFE